MVPYSCFDCCVLCVAGSEPSLGGRNEHHVASSESASKRTLVSQENMSPGNRDAANSVPHPGAASATLSNAKDSEPDLQSTEVTANFDSSPAKTPSYLNASRLASGYSPYSSYTPVLQPRNITVLRKSESESDSSLSRDSPPRSEDQPSHVTSPGQGQGAGEGHTDKPGHGPVVTNGHVSTSDLDGGLCANDSVDSAHVRGGQTTPKTCTRPESGDLAVGESAAPGGVTENGVSSGDLELQLSGSARKLSGATSPDTPAKVRIKREQRSRGRGGGQNSICSVHKFCSSEAEAHRHHISLR